MKNIIKILFHLLLFTTIIFLLASCSSKEEKFEPSGSENSTSTVSDESEEVVKIGTFELFAIMEDLFTEEDMDYFLSLTTEELIEYHFSLGLWLRNNYIYNGKLPQALCNDDFDHADDLSQYVIEQFHKYMLEQREE